MTAFVNGTARSRRAARTSSTASSTTACSGLVGERELVGAEPQRGAHRRVELAHRPLAELLDAEVERPHALHRPVREPLRERAVAVVEPLDRARERAVGVRLLLEDAQHDLERRAARGRDHRRPRRNSS